MIDAEENIREKLEQNLAWQDTLTWQAFRMTGLPGTVWCVLDRSWIDLLQAHLYLFQKMFTEELPNFSF